MSSPATRRPEDRPLEGIGVVVTRPRERAASLARPLEEAGARVWIAPVIRTSAPESWAPLDRAIERLRQYEWLVLTSAEGVESFVRRLLERERDVRDLAGIELAVIGRKTAARLREFGLQADLVPEEFRAEALVEALVETGVAGRTILVPRSAIAREVLIDRLVAAGAFVDEVPSYTIEPEEGLPGELIDALSAGEVDVVTFTSPSTVEQFLALGAEAGVLEAIEELEVACIGPVTADRARELGLGVAIVASEYTAEGLVAAIREGRGGARGGP